MAQTVDRKTMMAGMAELQRAPGGDRIWITRGHLGALGVSTLAIAVLSFLVGLELGRSGLVLENAPGQAATAAFLPEVADDQALELLLREVEQARRAEDKDPTVTFNTELARPVPTITASEAHPSSVVTGVEPGGQLLDPPPTSASDSTLPTSGWSVQIASYEDLAEADLHVGRLKELGHPAYRIEALVSGATWYRVRIGGNETRAKAEDARLSLMDQLGSADLVLAPSP